MSSGGAYLWSCIISSFIGGSSWGSSDGGGGGDGGSHGVDGIGVCCGSDAA